MDKKGRPETTTRKEVDQLRALIRTHKAHMLKVQEELRATHAELKTATERVALLEQEVTTLSKQSHRPLPDWLTKL